MSVDVAFGKDAGSLDPDRRELAVKHIAERLEASVRATDTLARIGDENFAVILEDLTHADHAERVKQIVLDALAEPLVVDGEAVAPGIDVDIEFYPAAVQGGDGSTLYN